MIEILKSAAGKSFRVGAFPSKFNQILTVLLRLLSQFLIALLKVGNFSSGVALMSGNEKPQITN
jgi:hypothetical protein